MKTHPENICSNCNNRIDAATTFEEVEALPKDGDISICAYCGQLGRYDGEMRVKKMNESEMYILYSKHPDVAEQVLKIQSIFAFISQKAAEEKSN